LSVTAEFAIDTYTLSYTAGANGSISGTTAQTVEHGADGSSVTAVADAHHHFAQWSDGLTDNPRTDLAVSADIAVTAEFENQAPTIAAIDDQQLLEDSSQQQLSVTVGDLESDSAQLTVTATSSQPGVILDPAISAGATPEQRTLSFTPLPEQYGVVLITVTVSDPGGSSSNRSFTVTVQPVNDQPSMTLGSNPSYPVATSGPRSISGFATFDAGPDNEDATQSVDDYLISAVSDPDGVLVGGAVDIANDGSLNFELSGVGGLVTASVRVRDSGGTANGGVDLSESEDFEIRVVPGADLQVAKDNGRTWLQHGELTLYVIVVANAGPNPVSGAEIRDLMPATLSLPAWTCVQASSTAACPTPGAATGDLIANIDLAAGEHLRFEVTGLVNSRAGAQVSNTVSVTVPAGITSIDPANDSATDEDPILPVAIFGDGFEGGSTQGLTVPAAIEAMQQ
ncbi:MAG: DUF11 domain-containing protein, partial [Xanthomonadales bacterium]|nr:DUF11 domain-containing protein [Xanthomonadales bacterium]